MLSSADSRALDRIGRNLTDLLMMTALLRLHLAAKTGFNPNQPRVPAGNPHGGEWTRVGSSQHPGNARPADTTTGTGDNSRDGPERIVVRDDSGEETWEAVVTTRRTDGSIAEQNVINRDGSYIRSEFASGSGDLSFDSRHTVVGVDGSILAFENTGPDQLVSDGTGELLAQVSWVPEGPGVEIYRPDLLGPDRVVIGGILLPTLMGLGLVLHDWLSSTDDSDQHTVTLFSAREYVRGAGADFVLDSVRRLERDEVDDFCPRYGEVQARTDEAVETVRRRGALDLTPQAFGTAVHLRLKQQVEALNDPDFRAEVSLLKSAADQVDDDLLDSPTAHYGQFNTLRVDVLENVGGGTVCVFDIKTGRRKLSLGRSMELAQTVLKRYPKTARIVMMEVRATSQ